MKIFTFLFLSLAFIGCTNNASSAPEVRAGVSIIDCVPIQSHAGTKEDAPFSYYVDKSSVIDLSGNMFGSVEAYKIQTLDGKTILKNKNEMTHFVCVTRKDTPSNENK